MTHRLLSALAPVVSVLCLFCLFVLHPLNAYAGCGCDKPPPPPASVRPNVTYGGTPVFLFSPSLQVGQMYVVRFTSMSGQSATVSGQAVSRRDLADGLYKPQLTVALPPLPLGPASITVTQAGQTLPFLSIPDASFTVAPQPIVIPDQVGSFSYQNFQAAVGRDGRVYFSLDVTGTTMPRTFQAQAKGWPLRFTKDTTVFYNTQGFLMQLANAPIPGLFSLDAGTNAAVDSDIAQYARHEFNTYFLQHAEHLPHSVEPSDGNWHLDGSRHIDHNHLILTLAGTVNGTPPAAGTSPAFTLQLNTYSFFRHGLVGTDAINMDGATSTASYSSTTSLAGATAPTGAANVTADTLTNGTLAMSNTAVVNGHATAAAFKLSGQARITGQKILATQPQTFIPVSVPKGLTDLGTISLSEKTQTLVPGSYQVNDLILQDGGRLIINNAAGPVTLYVTGQIQVAANASITPMDPNPEKFAVYVASSRPVSLSGTGIFYGVVYAPQSVVSLSGNGMLLGSFIAQQMKLSGSAAVRYDTALRGQ